MSQRCYWRDWFYLQACPQINARTSNKHSRGLLKNRPPRLVEQGVYSRKYAISQSIMFEFIFRMLCLGQETSTKSLLKMLVLFAKLILRNVSSYPCLSSVLIFKYPLNITISIQQITGNGSWMFLPIYKFLTLTVRQKSFMISYWIDFEKRINHSAWRSKTFHIFLRNIKSCGFKKSSIRFWQFWSQIEKNAFNSKKQVHIPKLKKSQINVIVALKVRIQ